MNAIPPASAPRQRLLVFDALRGVAVLLMLMAHSASVLGALDGHRVIGVWAIVGNTVCYTAFVLTSGAVAYLAYLRRPTLDGGTRWRLARRNGRLLLLYYGAALFMQAGYVDAQWGGWSAFARQAWRILSLQMLVGYTEFLFPLAVYGASILLLWPVYRFLAARPWALVAAGLGSYALGTALWHLFVPHRAYVPWLSLLVGGGYSFSLLHYVPVLLAGIAVGRLVTTQGQGQRPWWGPCAGAGVLALAAAVAFAHGPALGLSPGLQQRWPPSPAFLLLGLGSALLALALLGWAGGMIVAAVERGLAWIGRHALSTLLGHYLALVVLARGLHVANAQPGPWIGAAAVVLGLALLTAFASDQRAVALQREAA